MYMYSYNDENVYLYFHTTDMNAHVFEHVRLYTYAHAEGVYACMCDVAMAPTVPF